MRKGTAFGKQHARSKRGSFQAPREDGVTLILKREFTKARNYFDLLRAALAGLGLAGGYGFDGAIRVKAGAENPTLVVALQVTILAIGLLTQLLRWERGRLALAAPVFYVAGVTIGFCSPIAGICAFAIAWALTTVIANAQGFLTVEAIVLAGVGYVTDGLTLQLLAAVGLCFLPVVLSLLAKRPLTVFARRASSSASSAHA